MEWKTKLEKVFDELPPESRSRVMKAISSVWEDDLIYFYLAMVSHCKEIVEREFGQYSAEKKRDVTKAFLLKMSEGDDLITGALKSSMKLTDSKSQNENEMAEGPGKDGDGQGENSGTGHSAVIKK